MCMEEKNCAWRKKIVHGGKTCPWNVLKKQCAKYRPKRICPCKKNIEKQTKKRGVEEGGGELGAVPFPCPKRGGELGAVPFPFPFPGP